MQNQRLSQQYTQRTNLYEQDNGNNKNKTSNELVEYLSHKEM